MSEREEWAKRGMQMADRKYEGCRQLSEPIERKSSCTFFSMVILRPTGCTEHSHTRISKSKKVCTDCERVSLVLLRDTRVLIASYHVPTLCVYSHVGSVRGQYFHLTNN